MAVRGREECAPSGYHHCDLISDESGRQVWTRSARTKTPDAEHIPVASFKAHDGPVNSMTFFRVLGADPERPPLRLATTGAQLHPVA